MSKEVWKAVEKIDDADEQMRDRLKDMPDALELYDAVCDAYDEENAEASECYYAEGFRVGF